MKRVRFRDPAGTIRGGRWVVEDGEAYVTTALGASDPVAADDRTYRASDVDVLAPAQPTKIVCIGRNFVDHADEQDADVPDRPLLFLKPPNTVASHGSTVSLLAGKERIDHEAELAVVIGETCHDVDASDAEDVIAGYTCFNDLSNRDDQRVETNWVRGKAFDNAAPMGPVLATPEEVPADASIELRVNGETRQSGSREDMVFSVPELIAEITDYMTLEPGDVIATGTPAGVGPLENGDTVEIEIEGIGTLEHGVHIPE
ncbi:5-carboxymethyl-2-hydroxymuconateDelta-isomerase [Halorhabdus utahensis DSM 12940]|uniref:5-carboxymethyl-2-hydroxymuconateDelta-isomerase n=1 Tax=Halorhabdus utahensis (strain DSM 12940 / JCM 11049 / AX-2) TaxID=519442 RepID=C7NQK3_HALUD|nr:fumarylacetoacetate hydrolase family protein [Halorhabdus utahensis]ACV10462.1 5-carboxymethyl-2-hydroxymuconateDelta-isomerase [Halorhabdus utahensis DSM 12940]